MAGADSIIDSSFSEEQWMSKMRSLLHNPNDHETDSSTSIFQVPKSVKAIKPEAYTPQCIALGPYHNFQPKLFKTQRFKLFEVQILHQQFDLPEFEVLFVQLKRKVADVRACYDQHLDMSDDTLSWMMVINGLFLLKLIYIDDAETTEFFDSSGRRFSMDSILKDAIMIENQIPLLVLELLIIMVRSYPPSKPTSFLVMTMVFCRRISPILLEGKFLKNDINFSSHLLDLLYNLVCVGGLPSTSTDFEAETRSFGLFCDFCEKITELIVKMFQVVGISITLQDVEERPLVPTVSQLCRVKVRLCGINIGIMFINFKRQDSTLYLPVLTLNVNSEIIIRNLLAYEAMAKPETLNFARYIEMMATMIQTAKDVELLKKKNIVIHDGDNGEVVQLFNGIKDCIIESNSEFLDRVIKDINEYYDNTWKMKWKRILKYMYSSWKMLTVIATIWLLCLTTLQTFCSVISCPDIIKTNKTHLSFIARPGNGLDRIGHCRISGEVNQMSHQLIHLFKTKFK